MKKVFSTSLSLLLALSILSCKGPALKKDRSVGDMGQIELKVDGNKKSLNPTPIITSAYTNAHFLLSYLSDKDDVQFTISAYMQDLQVGTYQVYDCKSASECNENVPDNNQMALYAPYPTGNIPQVNLSRTAYYAPKLGLKPLILVITSIVDEKQPGNPYKTKRVKGHFSGDMAYVEQEKGGYEYHVVGKTTLIEGSFDMFCNIL